MSGRGRGLSASRPVPLTEGWYALIFRFFSKIAASLKVNDKLFFLEPGTLILLILPVFLQPKNT